MTLRKDEEYRWKRISIAYWKFWQYMTDTLALDSNV
jgi:hypothetical protein